MLGFTATELKQTRFYQEAREEGEQQGRQEGEQIGVPRGRQEGRQEGELLIILRLLKRRFGPLPTELEAQIRQLSLENIELLSDALLDFSTVEEVYQWLSDRPK